VPPSLPPEYLRERDAVHPLQAIHREPLHLARSTVSDSRGGKLVGTIWAISHDASKTFSTDDVRIVEKMTTFSSSISDALQMQAQRQRGRPSA
jgi:hypothetical protein